MTAIEKLEQTFTTSEQKKLLDSVKKGIEDLKSTNEELKLKVESLEGDIHDIYDDNEGYKTVVNPMGKVEYRVSGSLNIVQFMECVEKQIEAL